mgnify:CR=1 FL=1
MNSSTLHHIEPATTSKSNFVDRLAMHAVHQRLAGLAHGEVTLVDGASHQCYGQRDALCPLSVTLHVHDPRFYSDITFGGSIGAGEAYMKGYWSVNDLTDLVRILLQNRAVLDGMESGLARLMAPLQKTLHWINRNTREGSRRNIAAHYDLGNEFFALFLDPTMMYSSAIFIHPNMTLEAAQLMRLDHICRKLNLTARDHLLEIGTGWGGMALYAARHYGCRVTTTTLSQAQHKLATERVRAARLDERITVLLKDYRDLDGRYDKLVSIEMIEAVGHDFYDTYFGKCAALLKADGLMLLQAITTVDQRYDAARRSVDFIQRYIFPGSCIPSITAMSDSITRSSDLRLTHLEDIGPHYATTLRRWRENFFRNIEAVRALGYPESFIRMWELYLCYSEGGFEERALGDVQMLLAKPNNRRVPVEPTNETGGSWNVVGLFGNGGEA